MFKEIHSTKEKILEVARRLAVERGLDNLTIRDICKEAGVSVGAFYHHFSSKEKMMEDSFLIYDYNLYSKLDQYDPAQPLISLKKILMDQIIFVSSFPHQLVVEYYRTILSSPSKNAINEKRTYYRAVDKFVGLAIEKGEFSSKYTRDYLTNYFIKHIRGNLIHWCMNPNNINLVEQTSYEIDELFYLFRGAKE